MSKERLNVGQTNPSPSALGFFVSNFCLGRLAQTNQFPSEKYQVVQTSTGIYSSTAVTCCYTIPQDTADASLHPIIVDHWELALTQCILQHPLLQSALLDEDSNKPAWAALEKIDLTQQLEWRIIGDAEGYATVVNTIIKDIVSTKFAALENRPGWRMVVLRQENGSFLGAIFCWHHAYADGMGGKAFHETLLQCLNTTDRKIRHHALENHVVKTTASEKNMPPPQEAAGKYPVTLGFVAEAAWEKLKPPILSTSNPFHVNWARVRISPCETQLMSFSIDHITLQAVLSSCRTHNTTLTGLLHALALLSLTSQLPEKDAQAIASHTAVALRRHFSLRPPKYPLFDLSSTIANYISMMEQIFEQHLVSKIRSLTPQERPCWFDKTCLGLEAVLQGPDEKAEG